MAILTALSPAILAVAAETAPHAEAAAHGAEPKAGLPQLAVENWTAIMVPASTPESAVAKLGAEVLKIMTAPEIDERARTQGFRVDARGPQAFAAYLNNEVERWAKVIAAARISAD